MSEMKDSNVKWIGKIPYEWGVNRLRYVCDMKTGGTPDDKYGINTDEDGYPWITAQDMNETYKIQEYSQYIDQDAIKKCKYKLFPSKSILLVCIASVGKLGLIKEKAYSNQQITALMPNNMVNEEYLLYFIQSISHKIIADASSSVVPIVNTTYLKDIVCLMPSKKEQKLISAFLNNKIEKIDNILKDLNDQIVSLNDYKKALITETVTKGLNSNAKMKDSGIDWIGNIPKHWSVNRINNICKLKGRIGWQGLTTDEYIDEGPYLITGVDFSNGSIDWNNCEHVSEWRYRQATDIQIKENDLLITKDGTVGKIAIVQNCPEKVTLNSGVLLIRCLKNTYINRFLYYILYSNEFWHWFEITNLGDTTITHLYQNIFAKFLVALPDIKEQQEIVDYLDKKCQEIDELIEDKQQQIEKMEKYKKSLIYEYVTGKKRVKGAEELYG